MSFTDGEPIQQPSLAEVLPTKKPTVPVRSGIDMFAEEGVVDEYHVSFPEPGFFQWFF